MPGKGKILMGKTPGKRPGPVKPVKPKGISDPKRKVLPGNLGGKAKPMQPKPTSKPKGKGMLDMLLPGKPGDFKNMPSFLRKTKPVTRRGGK